MVKWNKNEKENLLRCHHYEHADERAMLAEQEGGEIVFINEFEMAPVNPNVQRINTWRAIAA